MFRRTLVVFLSMLAVALALPDLTRPVVTASDGERHLAGQLILELSPSLRGKVVLGRSGAIALFGVPALDQLNRRWRVDDVTPLFRHPQPGPLAQKYGCDLQYVIQFSPGQDIGPVAESYEALADVEYACPNGWMELDEDPNDPSFSRQWHLAQVGATYAWGVAKGDTGVVNCVLDDGADWPHEDIQNNLWINHPEDINGNGRFDTLVPPDGDLDGVDQDHNGYADDVIGYDFIYGDPNPIPEGNDDHGTHCWGNVNAVTNNATGVAGTTWNSRSMVVRCGGGGGVNLYAAIAALYYAVPENVWAFSMSFGSPSPYQPMADACQYAWDSGCVLFGSAGNTGAEEVRYPACYEGVENTAASDGNDMKAGFSTYGSWVDISAPGVGIYTTVPRHVGLYGSMDGTSMSAPLAAGVACWMKSFEPTMSNATCTSKMHAACDSMPDPLMAQGKLGAGRVSMANVVLPLYYCNLTVTNVRFNDASGNNNGRPDPGETASLIVTYANAAGWRNAASVAATLAAIGTEVQVTKSTATFPDIPAGSSANCSADSFVITVGATAPPQEVSFYLTVDADPDPAYPDTGFSVVSGEPRVLIVDDDRGSDYERWYTSACDSNGILYHVYSVETSGSPSAETLRHYPVVIWFCGDDSLTTLTGTDRANLASYLDNGGKLLVSGQNIAQNISAESFLADYLHAQLAATSTGKPFLVGLPGDPITRGDTMVTGSGGGANNARSLDGVRPVNGGIGCAFFKDYGDTTVQAVVRYTDGYRVVFFPVPFEAIDHSAARYLQKWTLIRRIFEYFGERVPGVVESPPAAIAKRPYVLDIRPNPFGRTARVSFIAPVTGKVELRTYTITGQLVGAQESEVVLGAQASFVLEAEKLANGVYLVQLVTPEGVFAQKTAVLR